VNIEEIVKMACYNLQEIAQKRKNSLQNATTKLEPGTGLEMRAGLEPAPTEKVMLKIFLISLFIIIITALGLCFYHESQVVVFIQPFGNIDQNDIKTAQAGITGFYNVKTVILPGKILPSSTYYKPRKRYRADKLLDYLETITTGQNDKIIGLTTKDISTTKGKYYDWGIFGLGSIDGKTCVVSTYRLKRGKTTQKVFAERLIKVVNHELGHTFGLYHCPGFQCLMQDAKGSIRTMGVWPIRSSTELAIFMRLKTSRYENNQMYLVSCVMSGHSAPCPCMNADKSLKLAPFETLPYCTGIQCSTKFLLSWRIFISNRLPPPGLSP
jgi:archaemetzincin